MMDQDSYVVIASYGGSATNPSWYLNLIDQPRASVQVKGRKVAVTARTVTAEAREQLWSRLIAKAPLYQKFQDSTARQIPLVLLTPAT
jgi:deazaflavin-dependent oxidoreductase (nitroreductase family)